MPDTDRVSELVHEAERLKKEAQTIREKSAQLIARAEELTVQVVQLQEPQVIRNSPSALSSGSRSGCRTQPQKSQTKSRLKTL